MKKKILVVYPGRFQPFHKGHGQVFKWLSSRFDEAVVATSNKVDPPRSPFTFEEKKRMMTLAGVPANKVHQVVNPYIAKEVLRKYDPENTILLFAVSQKDMDEDPRFSFKPTKSGRPSYLQPYKGNEKNLQPFGDPEKPTGYVVVTPTFTFKVLGEPAKSATEIRRQFSEADNETQAKIVKDLFGRYDRNVHKNMSEKIKPINKKSIKNIKESLYEEITRKELAPMLDSFVKFASKELGIKSLPNYKFKSDSDDFNSFAAYNPKTREIVISTKNRHPMDVFRSFAHELVHHKQNEDGRIGKDIKKEGETGSPQENEANAEAGKIMRNFAMYNPTLFQSPYIVEEFLLNEGLNDPANHKVVFLGGGPGSGKDFVLSRVLANKGMTEVNSDAAFELLMKKAGLDFRMPDSELERREVERAAAKEKTNIKHKMLLGNRRGLIINGTASDPDKILRMKKELEDAGYETQMVFVNTRNEVSRQRNIERGERGGREVDENMRQENWNEAQAVKKKYAKIFGENFAEIDNSEDLRTAPEDVKNRVLDNFNQVSNKISNWAKQPSQHPEAVKWREQESKRLGVEKPKETAKRETQPDLFKSQQKREVDQNMISQARRLGLSYYGFGRFGRTIKGKNTVTHHEVNGKLQPINKTVNEDLRQWFSKTHPEGGWKRINSKGEAIGPCAREPGEPKPKCMSNKKRKELTTKQRANAVRIKRKYDSNPERQGSPINVSNYGKGKISENIESLNEMPGANFNKPRQFHKLLTKSGYSHIRTTGGHAHYENKKGHRVTVPQHPQINPGTATKILKSLNLGENVILNEKNKPTNPSLWSKAKSLARQKFDVYPSAYANGWAAKWYKSKGGGWKSVSEESPSDVPMSKTDAKDMKRVLSLSEKYQDYMNNPANREQGTTSLADIYTENTPGQSKKKVFKKKLAQEKTTTMRGGLPVADGIGPEITQYRPFTVTGFTYNIAEWANDERVQKLYFERYGEDAENRLYEAACKLEDRTNNKNRKTIKQIKDENYNYFNPGDQKYPSIKGTKGVVPFTPAGVSAVNEEKSPAWSRKEGQSETGGLNRKGIESYRRENPGSKLSMAVTTEPSKLKKGSKKAKRRLSFCRRMKGMKKKLTSAKTARDPDSRINKSLRKWNCEE